MAGAGAQGPQAGRSTRRWPWLAARLLRCALVLWGTLTVLFLLVHLMAPDPRAIFLDPEAAPEAAAARVAELGLDQPLWAQYLRWLRHALVLDLGESFHQGVTVAAAIASHLPFTLLLGSVALVLALALAVALALLAARRPGSVLDRTLFALATALHAMPSFWLGLMALAVVSRWLPQHPLGGAWSPALQLAEPGSVAWPARAADLLQHLLLPAATLLALEWGGLFLLARTSLLAVLGEDFIRAARARGLSEARVLLAHALPNAALPLCAAVGLHVPLLLSGAVVIESVFAWPGMGTLLLDAVLSRDFPVVLGVGIVATLGVLAGSLLADVLLRWLDPRVAHA